MEKTELEIVRIEKCCKKFGVKKSTYYNWIKNELMPPGISLGTRSVGWLTTELDAVLTARISGKSESEIRQLTKKLLADRKNIDAIA